MERNAMKRTLVVATLLIGTVLAAHADSNVYDDIAKHKRSDAALQGDVLYCNYLYGMTLRYTTPTAQYRQCMLSRGWRYSHHERDNTYVDHYGRRHCED